MSHVVKADSAADFLALVPFLVGHQPCDSLVLVGFRGNRTHGAFRFDLPRSNSEPVHARVATSLIGMLCKLRDVDAVVPVVYTNQTFDSSGAIPLAGFADRIVSRARSAGFLVREALCVAQNGWASYLEGVVVPGAHPLQEIAASGVHAALPADQQHGLITPAERAELPAASDEERSRVRAALRGSRKGVELDASKRLIHAFLLAEAALDRLPEQLPAEDLATLLVLLEHHGVRDLVMLQLAWGMAAGIGGARELLALSGAAAAEVTPDGMPTPIIDTVVGVGEQRPDIDRVEKAIELLKAVAARAPRGQQPAPLCMIGWLNWALGRTSVAARLVSRARGIDPGYRFAVLLRSMFDTGRLPEWAFIEPRTDPGS